MAWAEPHHQEILGRARRDVRPHIARLGWPGGENVVGDVRANPRLPDGLAEAVRSCPPVRDAVQVQVRVVVTERAHDDLLRLTTPVTPTHGPASPRSLSETSLRLRS